MTLKEIQQQLQLHANPAAVAASRKFIPGDDIVYGVRNPVLNQLAKEAKAGGFVLVDQLWKAGSLEERIVATKLLGHIAKTDPVKTLSLIEKYAAQITNWALCDTMGMQSVASLRKKYAAEIFELAERLNTAAGFWERRLSLVLVEWYTREPERHAEIHRLVNNLRKDKEYYVKKAIVWIEKNFSKQK